MECMCSEMTQVRSVNDRLPRTSTSGASSIVTSLSILGDIRGGMAGRRSLEFWTYGLYSIIGS